MNKADECSERTKEYFSKLADEYAENIISIQPQLYKNSGDIINNILKKSCNDCLRVLDIGNGGVINYDYKSISELVCADLYISSGAENKYSKDKNVKFIYGDINNINYQDGYFDIVIVQAVIHHLAKKNLKETLLHVQDALNECMRILKKGGRLVIMESTVVPWFEKIEIIFYPFMQLFFKICRFGPVYQFSNRSLKKMIQEKGYYIEEIQNVDLDKFIWIMNKKVYSKLTPCRFVEICIQKE